MSSAKLPPLVIPTALAVSTFVLSSSCSDEVTTPPTTSSGSSTTSTSDSTTTTGASTTSAGGSGGSMASAGGGGAGGEGPLPDCEDVTGMGCQKCRDDQGSVSCAGEPIDPNGVCFYDSTTEMCDEAIA
jgi:hypothetical protein